VGVLGSWWLTLFYESATLVFVPLIVSIVLACMFLFYGARN